MKKITLIAAMMLSMPVFAGNYGSGTGAVSGSYSESNASASGNNNFVIEASEIPTETTTNVDYNGSYKLKNVPNVGAPALASSNDTCMGSTSGGIGVAGFGFSLGSTWTDKNCKMLKNSRELWNMGMRAAAMARMCMDSENKEALELTGYTCPTKKEDK